MGADRCAGVGATRPTRRVARYPLHDAASRRRSACRDGSRPHVLRPSRVHQRTKVAFFRTMMRATAARAAALIAVSRHTADRLGAVLAPRAPVVVATHGVDHDRFRPGPRDDASDVSRLRALGVRRPYVAFQGTIEPRKDVPTLIAAFAVVAR